MCSLEHFGLLPFRPWEMRGRRVDIFFRLEARRILYDVVIADPTLGDILRQCAASSHLGHAVCEAARAKERAYQDCYPGGDSVSWPWRRMGV